MSNLSDYISRVLKEGISPETARRAMEAYEAKHPTPTGIPVNIPLDSDEDISKCPRCGASIDRQPQPSLHLASTFYECETEVITFIDAHANSYIERIGRPCLENVKEIRNN